VADKMGSRLEKRLEPDGLVLEVDLSDIGSRWKAAPVRRHDLVPLGEWSLSAPGQLRVDDGTVN
jgi:hypothetical protein